MKKKFIFLMLLCVCCCVLRVKAAVTSDMYTVGTNEISNIPVCTSVKSFLSNINAESDAPAALIQSITKDSYSLLHDNSIISSGCLLLDGEALYTLKVNESVGVQSLSIGKTTDLSSALKQSGEYIRVSFQMQTEESFSYQSVKLNTGSASTVAFVTLADGFTAIEDSSGKAFRISRYQTGESLFVEIFLKRSAEKFTVEKVFVNGDEFSLADKSIPLSGGKLKLTCLAKNRLQEIFAAGASECRSGFKKSTIFALDNDAYVLNNYGINNENSIYYEDFSAIDSQFGNFITEESGALIVSDYFTDNTASYEVLGELPRLSKVRLFKDGEEIFALESGEVTIKREIPSRNVIFIARYDDSGFLKEISHEKTAVMNVSANDLIKVFVFESTSDIKPVYVAAEITKDGIFANDGYEITGGDS